MSRIRDALRQAAQEREGDRPTEVSPRPDSAISSALDEGNIAVESETGVLRESVRPSRRNVLPFDELRAQCAHPVWHPDRNSNVFAPGLSTHAAEQFRTLRSRLYQLRNDQPLRTILVTSSISGEGKTFVANNLAHAIVRKTDQHAVLIDADLRRPRHYKMLGAPAAPGLSEYLSGNLDETAIIQQGPQEGLCFIPAGDAASNHSELLANNKLKTLLDRLTSVFDWVILDSPPCLPVADPTVLAALCDAVLVVLRAKVTPAAAIQKTCQLLEGRYIAGVVLNGADETHSYDTTYYYDEPAGVEAR